MKTLYISDLDGTLLRSDQRTSAYTNACINELTARGLSFSYATARALQTSRKVTEGLEVRNPVVLQNGSFIKDAGGGEILLGNYFEDARAIAEDLISHGVFPIVYSCGNGADRFFYAPDRCSPGVGNFVRERTCDPRRAPVASYLDGEIDYGTVFYFTCIDEADRLRPLFEKYRTRYHCEFQRNLYTGEQWLEIMPERATKANGILWLKEYLRCDKVVVFGDDTNDIDMFRAADECYAMENAVDALKEIATAVIGSNEEDGVARWLERYALRRFL